MKALTEAERLELYLQFSILSKIDPESGWDEFAEIVQKGYTAEYRRFNEVLYQEVSPQECEFVQDVLMVFDALQRPFVDAREPVPNDCQFLGFDGNGNSKLIGYAEFLREHGRWAYIVAAMPDLNSHFPVEGAYRRMIAAWNAAGRPHMADQEQAKAILSARVHPDNRPENGNRVGNGAPA